MGNELSALAEVAGDTIDRLAIRPAQSLHSAIAGRVFDATGASALPVRVIHDAVAGALYSASHAAATGAARVAGIVIRNASGDADVEPLSRSRRGRLALSATNAIMGDLLEERGSALAVPMAVRRGGVDVPCDKQALARAFPRATPQVAVFLHGLAETEDWWHRGNRRAAGARTRPFGARLRRDLGIVPVEMRYNTGLHISENGRRLSDLLDALVNAWPVPMEDLVLIGHSMGGLVARSACHAATGSAHGWTSRLRHVVTLGTPHHGAPLEKVVYTAARLLRNLPESRPFADILDLRSAGIRDLRYGNLSDDDWRDAGARRSPGDQRTSIPLLDGCEHTFITATVTRDPAHPIGWVVGDLLVRTDSAGGRCGERTIPVPPESVIHVGGLTHFDLLDHPLVYVHLRELLARAV